MADEALRGSQRAFAREGGLAAALELLTASARRGEVDRQALGGLLEDAAWSALPEEGCRQVAAAVAQWLGGTLRFERLETHAMGGQQRRVALFSAGERSMALIPGGEAELGFDPASFRPSLEQSLSWEDTEDAYDLSLQEYLRDSLSPPRRVRLAPFLLDTVHEPLSDATRAAAAEALAADGFRLPTTDEWEYACAAGTRTLFRWGNDCPSDAYPTDAVGADYAGPNSFGVAFGTNPYRQDLCADGARGGDGGVSICGGAGFFCGWLALSTWFADPDGLDYDESSPDYYRLRRVLSLEGLSTSG